MINTKAKANPRAFGAKMENVACDYLQKQGLRFKQCNYSCKMGEIDLIMQDGEFIVFVEVRYRKSKDYGGPIATITKSKQHKIIRTALFYLVEHNQFEKVPCRFDVVAIDEANHQLQVEWIKSAFDDSRQT